MPVQKLGSTYNTVAGVNTDSFTLSDVVVPSGTGKVLVVALAYLVDGDGIPDIVTSVTFNGSESLTKEAFISENLLYSISSGLWYLVNPTETTGDIVVSCSQDAMSMSVSALIFENVNQITPFFASSSAVDETTSASVSVSSDSVNNLVVDSMGHQYDEVWTAGTGQTEHVSVVDTGQALVQYQVMAGVSTEAGNGSSVTMSWGSSPSRDWAITAGELQFSENGCDATYGPYTWGTLGSSDEDGWIFTDPVGTGVQAAGTARRWCHETDDTASTGVGPTSGQGGNPDGYLYTEASSPGAFNDEFTMELDYDLDASASSILVELYTNQRGDDNDATCEIQTNEGAAGWVTRATYGGPSDPNKVATSGTQIWASRSLDLTGIVSHASTRIRFLITFPASGTSWHNDYGIDGVTISLTCLDTWCSTGIIDTVVGPASVNGVVCSNIAEVNTV